MSKKHAFRRAGRLILRDANRARDHGSRVNPYKRLPPDDLADLSEDEMYKSKETGKIVRLLEQGTDPKDERGGVVVKFEGADGKNRTMPSHEFFAQFEEADEKDAEAFDKDAKSAKSGEKADEKTKEPAK